MDELTERVHDCTEWPSHRHCPNCGDVGWITTYIDGEWDEDECGWCRDNEDSFVNIEDATK